ncbi:MAG: glutathione S-transferase, partial [Pseudomonadota bacterium]
APEGGISLDKYPTLKQWIATIESIQGFVPMPSSDIPEARA